VTVWRDGGPANGPELRPGAARFPREEATLSRSTPDDIAVAQLAGAVSYARTQGMSREQAIAHLHEITTRPDLLAHAAGIKAGAGKANPMSYWPWDLADARILVDAGADRELLRRWIAQGIDNVRRRWAQGPVTKPDPAKVDAVYREVTEGLS
jgi:hypothetical protein